MVYMEIICLLEAKLPPHSFVYSQVPWTFYIVF